MIKKILKRLINPSISYGITVNNETQEIKKLLEILVPLIDKNDEIIVLQDITNESHEVTNVLNSYEGKIIRIKSRLNGDFATFKNNLIQNASKKYLFQIDADEFPKVELLRHLKWFLIKNYKSDCFLIPRINIVNGITEEDLENWKWNKNEKGYINFPDFQTRLFRLKKEIVWQNKIHETLINFKKLKPFPIKTDALCIVHIKEIDKQKKQNSFYDTL